MKLYATTTSERASKGQGGNKYIDLSLSIGSTKKSREVMTFRAEVIDNKVNIGIWKAEKGTEPLFSYPLKGERQKGEKCEGCGEPILENQSRADNRHSTCI